MKEEKTWITKEGKEIPYSKLEDSHLLNILKLIERRAKELDGKIIDGGGIWDIDDIWYREGTEEEWREKFGYAGLKAEAIKRNLFLIPPKSK
jgi:hypothetical protein